MTIINQITESITQPASAVPITVAVGAANWLSSLPEIINILTTIYIALLIIHKGWKMYVEWRQPKLLLEDKEV